MTVGSRMVFMRFATAESPKLQPWLDHFERVVGRRPITVASTAPQRDECLIVWQLISANNRMLARSAHVYEDFEDAVAGARTTGDSVGQQEVFLRSDRQRGEYGWYNATDGDVTMTCSRWYSTRRDRQNAIELALSSAVGATLSPGARPIDVDLSRGLRDSLAR